MSGKVIDDKKKRNIKPIAPSKPAPINMRKKIITNNKSKKNDTEVIETSSVRKNSRSVAAELVNKNVNDKIAGPPVILSVPAALFSIRTPNNSSTYNGNNNMDDNASIGSLASYQSLNNQSLNGSIVESCIYSDAHEELLQTHYNAAKKRVIELSQSTNAPFHLKMHTSTAVKIYTAISTLLYATLSIARANELDFFIRQNSVHLPQSIFDLNEWNAILNLARDHRGGGTSVGVGTAVDGTNNNNLGSNRGKVLMKAAAYIKNDLQTMKKNIVKEMAAFDDMIASVASQIKAKPSSKPVEQRNKATDVLKDEIAHLNAKHKEEIRDMNEKHAEETARLREEYAHDIKKLQHELDLVKSLTDTTSTPDDVRARYEDEINSLKATIASNDEQLLQYKTQIIDGITDKDARILALEQELLAVRSSEQVAPETDKFNALNEEYNAAVLKLNALNELVASTQSECKLVTGKLQNECEKNTVLTSKLVELESIPKADLQEIERLHGEIALLRQRTIDLEAHIEESARPSDPIDESVDPKELLQKEVESNKILSFKLKQAQVDLEHANKAKSTLADQLSAQAKDRETIQAELTATSTQLQVVSSDHEGTKTQLQAALAQTQAISSDHEATKTQLQAALAQTQAISSDHEATKTQLQAALAQVQAISSDHEATQAQLQAALAQVQAINNNREAIQALAQESTSSQLQSSTKDLEATQAQLQAALAQVEVVTKDYEAAQVQIQTLIQYRDTLSNKFKELQRSLDESVTAKAQLNEQVSKEQASNQNQLLKIKELEKKIEGLSSTAQGGVKGSEEDKQVIISLQKRINDLEKASKTVSAPRSLPSLSDYSPAHHKVAVEVQKLIRGFLGRAKVKKLLMKHVASDRGILVACDGTHQGETGWYCEQDLYFYFCLDAHGNYLLLCGPITKEMYDLAKLEAESIYDATLSSGPNGWLNKSLAIDYEGLSGARIQIETLVDDLKEKNAQLELTSDTLNEYKNQVKIDMQNLNINHHEEIKRLANENIRLQSIINKLSSQRIIDAKNSANNNQLNEDHLNCIVKVQAAMRGIKCRQELIQAHRAKFAEKDGVMHAVGRTVQGEEGWYQNSKDSVLYFVIDESGKWKCLAGPLDKKLYDILVRPPVVKGIKNTNEVKLYKFNASCLSSEFQGLDVYVQHDTQKLCALVGLDSLTNSTY